MGLFVGLESLRDGTDLDAKLQDRLFQGVESALDGVESALDGVESLVDGVESLVDGVESAVEDAVALSHALNVIADLFQQHRESSRFA